jgi:MSHA biogenesis protein MshL
VQRILLASLLVPVAVTTAASQSVPLPPLPITRLDVRQADPDLDGPRISVRFSDPTPIRDILFRLVRDTRLSVIPDPSLEQTFIGDLKNVTLREALDLIVEPFGLDYSVRDRVIRVSPPQLETRFYSIDYVITQRTASRSITATTGAPAESGGAQGGSTLRVSGTDSPNLYVDLAEGVRTLLSKDGRMNLDRSAALLQVTDRPNRLAKVEQYLEAVMLRVTRQVQIEAHVIEVTLREEFSAGIDWRMVLSGLTNTAAFAKTPAPTTSGGLTLRLKAGDFTALMTALAAQGTVNVLANPRITAMNNVPAVMRIGTQDVFFVTTNQVDPQGQIKTTAVTPAPLIEGVTLSVTPQVSVDGIIHLSISPSVTQKTGVATSRSGDTASIITVREADTLVRVQEGETVVIAGLMQDRAHANSAKSRKTDLVILITPTVMRPGDITASARDVRPLEDTGTFAAKAR